MHIKNALSLLLLVSSMANAEIKPFINTDLGWADTDFDDGIYLSLGGGFQFNEYVELEIGYNNFGEVGPFEIEVTSLSFGLNLGGNISETVKIFATLGSERLEADDEVSIGPFDIRVNESSTEAFFGIGVAFLQKENVSLRTKLVSHDSGDLTTVSVGFAIYF